MSLAQPNGSGKDRGSYFLFLHILESPSVPGAPPSLEAPSPLLLSAPTSPLSPPACYHLFLLPSSSSLFSPSQAPVWLSWHTEREIEAETVTQGHICPTPHLPVSLTFSISVSLCLLFWLSLHSVPLSAQFCVSPSFFSLPLLAFPTSHSPLSQSALSYPSLWPGSCARGSEVSSGRY